MFIFILQLRVEWGIKDFASALRVNNVSSKIFGSVLNTISPLESIFYTKIAVVVGFVTVEPYILLFSSNPI